MFKQETEHTLTWQSAVKARIRGDTETGVGHQVAVYRLETGPDVLSQQL